MLIGELVKKSGFSKDTIRFYEKKGLLKLNKRSRRDNNYKEYPEEILEKLSIIKTTKSLGFTLKEINSFIKLWEANDTSCQTFSPKLLEKIDLIDQQIKDLKLLKKKLLSTYEKCHRNECVIEKNLPSCIGVQTLD